MRRTVAHGRHLWLVGFLALGGITYSALGIAMAASLSPSDPVPGERSVAAYVYLITFALSLVALGAAAIGLWRRRRRHDQSNNASAAA